MFLLHNILGENAGLRPESIALVGEGAEVSHAELHRQSDAVAGALQESGIGRGDRVLLIASNSLETAVCLWGILKAAAVVVPLSPETRPARLRVILGDCSPSMVVAPGDSSQTVDLATQGLAHRPTTLWTTPVPGRGGDLILPEVLGGSATRLEVPGLIDQDLATIIYTSGTTGEPKGVMLTHRSVANTTESIATYLRQTPDDVISCVLPLAFSYGLFQLLTAARVGSSLVLERSFAFPYDVLRRVQRYRATMFPAVPTIFAKLLDMLPLKEVDIGSLRCLTNAAAAIAPTHVQRLLTALPGAAFFAMYGQTECTRALFLDPALTALHPDSVGRAIPNCEVYLADEQGGRIAPGPAEGELVVRGANVMRGYWGRPDATAQKLRDGEIAGEKVLMTGDRFRIDGEGLAYFISRTDDIFKCRGEKVAPCAIEHVLCELPEVAEAAVVGIDDADDGKAIKAFIVPRAGMLVSEKRIRQHCRARLEAALVPRFIEMRESLPTTQSGKVRRLDLRSGPSA